MTRILNSNRVRWIIALALLWCCVSASAQDAAPDGGIEIGAPVVETNPAVRAALELPRESPADHFQAIVWLIDLGQPELAKPILEELAKLPLTDAQRAALVAEFGTRDMLLLSRTKELAPSGATFADACMAAAAAAANDPQRIATLVAQLTDLSPEVRQMAQSDLAATGQIGVTATLEALAKAAGAKRALALNVSGAFHSPLMAVAEDGLREHLAGVAMREPVFPVVSNVTAEPVSDAATAKELLVRQLTSPVRWTASMRTMRDRGVTAFHEIGPGNVLAGLMKRIDREAGITSLGTAEQIESFQGD